MFPSSFQTKSLLALLIMGGLLLFWFLMPRPLPPRDPLAPLKAAVQRHDHAAALQFLRDYRATTGHVLTPFELFDPQYEAFRASAEFYDWQIEAGQ